jgi:hypothetical protein
MSDETGGDDWGIHPVLTERRGEFPRHGDGPRPVLTRDAAQRYAAGRLAAWRAEHPDGGGE